MIASISYWMVIGLFISSISFWFSLRRLYILGIHPFILGCLFYWCTTVYLNLLRLCISMVISCNFFHFFFKFLGQNNMEFTSMENSHWSPIKTFLFFFFNWRIIALQCCVGFCHTTMQISHNYMYIPPSGASRPSPTAPSQRRRRKAGVTQNRASSMVWPLLWVLTGRETLETSLHSPEA